MHSSCGAASAKCCVPQLVLRGVSCNMGCHMSSCKLADKVIVSSVRESDDTEEQGTSPVGESANARDVSDAFGTIRVFRMHNGDVAMDNSLHCEGRYMRFVHGKCRQSKISEFWH